MDDEGFVRGMIGWVGGWGWVWVIDGELWGR